MSESHILLNRATSYARFTGSLVPEGCVYDEIIGAWTVKGTSLLFVDTPAAKRPQTKKADIETGEDQKGE